jgi:transposase
MKWQAAVLELNPQEIAVLTKIVKSKTLGVAVQERAQIVLAAAEGRTNQKIVDEFGFEKHRVSRWRNRWKELHTSWTQLDEKLRPPLSEKLVLPWLADRKGRGKKPEITEQQKALILAVACEPPEKSGYPHTHWTDRLLAQEVVRRGIVETVSHVWIWNFLKDKRSETAQKRVLPERRD